MKLQKYILLALSLVLSSAAFAHSKAFTPEFVDTLVAPYLQIQTQLAGDDLAASVSAADLLAKALQAAPVNEDAKATVVSLQAATTAIRSAEDIKVARSAFLALSTELQTLVEHVGTTGETPLFVAHCPMAFGGEGGSWLQKDKHVLNPYYGAMMLHCGGIDKQIAE
jgi:Cu(I)/Ag(I) efflux system membrane fusion protein